MSLLLFLFQVFVISISGAMQPGPVTATAITMGAKNRWAGVLIAVGHGIIEFPLMILIILGLGSIFQKPPTQITIGLIGGAVLLYMALSMFKSSSSSVNPAQAGIHSASSSTTKSSTLKTQHSAILAGIVLTVSKLQYRRP